MIRTSRFALALALGIWPLLAGVGCRSVCINVNILTTRSPIIATAARTNSTVKVSVVATGGGFEGASATVPLTPGLGVTQ